MGDTSFQGPVSGSNVLSALQISGDARANFNFHVGTPPPAQRPPVRPFSTVPFPQDPNFIQRTDILAWLRDQAAHTFSCSALVGLGGVGKSQVAIHYAYEVRRECPDIFVFWVHASSRERFEEAYRNIADRLELPGRDDPKCNHLKLVYAWLCDDHNGPWLMVIDNADSAGTFFPKQAAKSSKNKSLESFIPGNGRGSIVVTSRNAEVAERLVGLENILRIPNMTAQQAVQLLRSKLGRGLESNVDDPTMTELVGVLDCMPLTISQVAAYIRRKSPRTTVSSYLDEFRGNDRAKEGLLREEAVDLRRDKSASHSIVATWQITFEQIIRENPSAAHLLIFMSFFNAQGIPEFALRACPRKRLGGSTPSLEEALEVLRGYSLVTATTEGDVFQMHPLVQFCTQTWLSSFRDDVWWRQLLPATRHPSWDQNKWKGKFLQVMSVLYPWPAFETWGVCQRLDAHVDMILKKEPDDARDSQNWLRLLAKVALFRAKRRGKLNEAESMLRRGLEVAGKRSSKDLYGMYRLQSYFIEVLNDRGKHQEAEQRCQQLLKETEKAYGNESDHTVEAVARLAGASMNLGRYDEAERMGRRLVEGYTRQRGSEDPSTLFALRNLASTLGREKKDEEAEPIFRRVLGARERLLGKEHLLTIMSVQDLAVVLRSQGNNQEAEQMFRHVHEGYERIFGKESRETFQSTIDVGVILGLEGKYEESEQMIRQGVEGLEKVLGGEHHRTLWGISQLANLFQQQGKFSQSVQLYERGCNGYLKIFGPDHPETIGYQEDFAKVKDRVARWRVEGGESRD